MDLVCGVGIMDVKKAEKATSKSLSYLKWRHVVRTCHRPQKTQCPSHMCESWLVFSQFKKDFDQDNGIAKQTKIKGEGFYGPAKYIKSIADREKKQCSCVCNCF